MPERDPYGDLIAGVLLVQRELVLLLESEGVLTRGDFQLRLEEHLGKRSAEDRASKLYVPMSHMVKALAAKGQRRASKH